MSTTRGGKRNKASNELEKSQPTEAGSNPLERKKPDRRFGKRQFTKEQQEKWRKRTKTRMKKSPRSTLRNELPEVLVAVLEEAHEGSCQHAKFLLDYAGAESLPDAKEVKKNRSLAELLVEKLGSDARR